MKTFLVFIKNWWRKDGNGNLVPNSGGRRTIHETGLTYDEARRCCKEYNRTHKPGQLDRKAEFTQE